MRRGTDYLLDVRGAIAPIALLKACRAFREMKRGETIEILVNDSDTRKDLFRVLPPAACELLDRREETSFSRFLLRKTAKGKAWADARCQTYDDFAD